MIFDMYADYFANWITGGNLVNKDKMSSISLKHIFNRFITKTHITKAWCVLALPVNYNNNLTEGIRQIMHKAFPDVKTIVHTYNIPVNIDVTSKTFTSKMAVATQQFERYASYYNKLREDEKLTGKVEVDQKTGRKAYINKKELLRIKDNKDSLLYIYDKATKNNMFFETYYFIQASSPDNDKLKRYTKYLTNLLNRDKIVYCELTGTLGQYLNNFCPATILESDIKQITPMLFSQENLSAMLPFRSKGFIGDVGLLLGVEWQSKLPLMVNFFESSAAQVALLLSKSGYGKTYVAFNIALQALALDIHCSVIDVKGNEWVKLKDFVDLAVVSLGGSNSRFVNTLRIDNLMVNNSNCLDIYNMAVSGTVTLFKILVDLDPTEGNIRDLEMVLDKAINKLYSKNGVVSNNYTTFHRSNDMKYEHLLDIIDDLRLSPSFTDNQKNICDLIKTRCNMFFTSDRFREAFSNEITVSEILDKPFVVYSLDKNRSELTDLDTVKIFMASFLDSQKQEFRKLERKHTIAFYEELQRCDQFSTLVEYIAGRVTGARSSNVSVFLLLNAISVLKNTAFAKIRSNITTKIIGLVEDHDIDTLCDDFGCIDIRESIETVCNNKDQYSHCFVIKYDTGKSSDTAIFKSELPNYMWEAFNTRERLEL